jgi:alkylation response protein AidB-like acyl-CoA dehydrogenase
MALGLRALRRVAGSDVVDRVGLRGPAERLVARASADGFRAASAASRAFTTAARLTRPARPRKAGGGDLFDLTPTDEQKLLAEAFGDFAADRLRTAAAAADEAGAPPPDVLAASVELGAAMLGIPEELGGVVDERSAVTTVLAGEALAKGDMGLAVACLAPTAVGTALGLWGDADQQARYLPELAGDSPPAAALALLEPRPLFDTFQLDTRASRIGDGYELSGVKSLVPRAADDELFLVAAQLDDQGPALFVVESSSSGIGVEPEPGMGLRAAATGRLVLEGVRLPKTALVGEGERRVYSECVQRGRIAWCSLAVGTAQAVLDYVIPYVNERVAFGEPISRRQAVAFAVADIGIELEAMRLLTYRAAVRADRGEPFAREASVARSLCAQKAMMIGSKGVQLLGGHGYVREHPVERWYRDLRAAGVMEGALLV